MPRPTFSENQLEAAKRLGAAKFSHKPRYNSFLFTGGLVRTFLVRTCIPATDKLYSRAVKRDPCMYCGATNETQRNQLGLITVVRAARSSKEKQDLLNVSAVCTSCNQRKRDKSPLHFMLERLDETSGVSIQQLSVRELLCIIVELSEKRTARATIERLAKKALEAFDKTGVS